jgi:hypothetical protein
MRKRYIIIISGYNIDVKNAYPALYQPLANNRYRNIRCIEGAGAMQRVWVQDVGFGLRASCRGRVKCLKQGTEGDIRRTGDIERDFGSVGPPL